MTSARHCSKPGCQRPALATLTYDYQDSTVVLGPLAGSAEPSAYDLCETHAEHLTAPRGWQIVRLATNFEPAPPSSDDLLALVDAVRRAAEEAPQGPSAPTAQASQKRNSEDTTAASRPSLSIPPLERGPFSRSGSHVSTHSGTSTALEDAHNPLDPKSEFAQRRSQFTVVPGSQTT